MNKILLLLIFFTIVPQITYGQLNERLEDLRAPSSPATYLIGFQPTTTLTPNNYQALEATLFNNFASSENNFVIPNDLAIEFTPYWFGNYGLTIDQYLNRTNIPIQFLRNLSVSIASTQNYVLEDSSKTNALSFGLRTRLNLTNDRKSSDYKTVKDIIDYQRVKAAVIVHVATLKATLVPGTTINEITDSVEKEFLNQVDQKLKSIYSKDYYGSILYRVSTEFEDNRALLNAFDPYNDDSYKVYTQQIDDLIDRVFEIQLKLENLADDILVPDYSGVYLILAYGSLINFTNNNFDDVFLPKSAFWGTLNYTPKIDDPDYKIFNVLNHFSFKVLARKELLDVDYFKTFFPSQRIFEENRDLGGAISIDLSTLSFNIEALHRKSETRIFNGLDNQGLPNYSEDKEIDYQIIGLVNYEISSDIALSYSFGKEFKSTLNAGEDLTNKISLTFGFNSRKKSSIQRN